MNYPGKTDNNNIHVVFRWLQPGTKCNFVFVLGDNLANYDQDRFTVWVVEKYGEAANLLVPSQPLPNLFPLVVAIHNPNVIQNVWVVCRRTTEYKIE